MKLGVCYYPEHWSTDLWASDAQKMAALGIENVRIGEFAWSRMEPTFNQFEWGWLDQAIETLAGAGLKVVLCTPTATPPKWLVDAHPEILAYTDKGQPKRFGSRRHYCFTSPVWREQTARICTKIAERYGDNSAIVGWQTDNEYGCHGTVLSYADHCRPAFQKWLKQRYGNIKELNKAWGTVFWSLEYSSFEMIDLPLPGASIMLNPTTVLDYQRFSSDMVIEYNRLQVDILRKYSKNKWITHNSMGFFTEYQHEPLAQDVDIITWDSYPLGFTNVTKLIAEEERQRYARVGHPDVSAFNHDLYRGLNPNWGIMEQQPGPINWADHNPSPLPGRIRFWTWEAFAHSAQFVSYFRWRQAPFAQEQMHSGLNLPDNQPSRTAGEVRQVHAEREKLTLELQADRSQTVCLIFDYEAVWAYNIQPQAASFNYLKLCFSFYTALRRWGVNVDIRFQTQDLSGYKLVIVPSLPIVKPQFVQSLQNIEAKVVFGPRSGSKTSDFQIPAKLPPGLLAEVLPMQVLEVSGLPVGVQDCFTWNNQTYLVDCWSELLATKAKVLASFDNQNPAIVGNERFSYLGFLPNADFLKDFLGMLLKQQGIHKVALPEDVRVRHCKDHSLAFNYGAETHDLQRLFKVQQTILGSVNLEAHGLTAWQRN